MATHTWIGVSNSTNALQIQGNNVGSGLGTTTGQAYVWNQATHQFELNTGLLLGGPSADQTVAQPKGTSFNPNVLGQVRYATSYSWSQSPSSPSSITIGANTVTINAVLGVSAYSVSKVKHYLWIAAQGTPERVLITATTCTGINTGTCTVTFTAAFTHLAGYSLGTATAGWQEAWVDAFPLNVAGSPNVMVASKLAGSPNNDKALRYRFNAPLDIDMQRGAQAPIVIDFQGSVVECFTSGLACIDIDTATAGTQYFQPQGLTIENVLIIPVTGMGRTADGSTKAIWDKGQKTLLRNIHFDSWGSVADVFDDLIVIDNDQMATMDHIIMNPGDGPPLTCDATYCGSGIKGTTTNAGAIGYIHNSDLSMQCHGNGVDWQSGNTVHVLDTVVQAFNQFGERAKGSSSNNPAISIDNVYNEVGSCTNPLGTGAAGLIVNAGWAAVRAGVGPVGKLPSFAATLGATQFNYYVVPKSSTLGTGNALLAGYCLSSGAGTCTVLFNQVGSSGTMTWDLIRTQGNLGNTGIAPYTANCTGGSVSACGSVALAITAASCSNNVCTVVDDVTASTSSYTVVAAPTFFPLINLWPGGIVLSGSSDTNNVFNGSDQFVSTDVFNPNTTAGGLITAAGRQSVSLFATKCGGTFASSQGWMSCANSSQSTAAIGEIKRIGSAAVSSTKGRVIFENDPFNTSLSTDIITLSDSNPGATSSTPGYRAASDANDTAIGYDQANAATSGFRLGYRAPVGHRWYVASIFDNSSWKLDLTSTLFSSKVPVRVVVAAFSSLASCAAGLEGSTASVNDSSTNTWGATVTGGGANHILAYCNGTNWTVAAK
jgi:hypothetical protein